MTQLTLLDEGKSTRVLWTGLRNQALAQLQAFLPRAGKAYATDRNYDLGSGNRETVSCLSPWIRNRLICEEDILRATLSRHSQQSADKFIQEVFWRSYFKGWLEQHSGVWSAYISGVNRELEDLNSSPELRALYESALVGETGIDCLDAWAVELIETGYLHNHARMWFASIWIFTLGLPWQLGADFFYRTLLDGDPASNTLSWRWVAGLHTKNKNYIARKENIEKYTAGRFSPEGLVVNAEPLVETIEHAQTSLPQVASLDDLQSYGLIITREDCHVESLPLQDKPKAILGLASPETRSTLATSKSVHFFTASAVTDATARAENHFDCPSQTNDEANCADSLIEFARSHDLTTLVTPYLPVGPMRDQIDAARPTLENTGIRFVQVMRPYDRECWPHATKGFFKLKAKIPRILEDLDIT